MNVVNLFVISVDQYDFVKSNGEVVHAQKLKALVGTSSIEFSCVPYDTFDFSTACTPLNSYDFEFDLHFEMGERFSNDGQAKRKPIPTLRLLKLIGSDNFIAVP